MWGKEAWLAYLKGMAAFSGILCIKDMVQHITTKSRVFCNGTEHNEDWHFYHDTLTKLTHANIVMWMRATIVLSPTCCILNCWIKQMLNLTIDFSCFHDRPVGNLEELMPLDNLCNNEVHEFVRTYVALAWYGIEYTCKDPCGCSFATPNEVAQVYKRISHPKTGVSSPSH